MEMKEIEAYKPVKPAGARGLTHPLSGAAREIDGNSPINISNKAQKFQEVKQAVLSSPDVNESKIAELKDRIKNGAYQVPMEQLADVLGKILP